MSSEHHGGWRVAAGAVALGLLLCGCGARHLGTSPPWVPDAEGWEVREVDPGEPLSWVIYARDSPVADVKEFRIVGLVDAEPEVAMGAVRRRILDEQYQPEGLQRQILVSSESEIVVYGLFPLPFPIRDREATERMVFSHDPSTGEHRMDAAEVETDEDPPEGVLKIPVVRNSFVIEPLGPGRSVVTNDSVHDLGGRFPNWVIYGPVRRQLVEDLHLVRTLSAEP
jgi:hypothetical protein